MRYSTERQEEKEGEESSRKVFLQRSGIWSGPGATTWQRITWEPGWGVERRSAHRSYRRTHVPMPNRCISSSSYRVSCWAGWAWTQLDGSGGVRRQGTHNETRPSVTMPRPENFKTETSRVGTLKCWLKGKRRKQERCGSSHSRCQHPFNSVSRERLHWIAYTSLRTQQPFCH